MESLKEAIYSSKVIAHFVLIVRFWEAVCLRAFCSEESTGPGRPINDNF